jgi:Fe-S-cluster containining protein
MCCKGQPVFLLPGDDAVALKAVPDTIGQTGRRGMRLPQKANEECAYLGDGGCTIYEMRPTVCRGFDCRDHYYKPAAMRRKIEALFGPDDMAIVRRGRELVERSRG